MGNASARLRFRSLTAQTGQHRGEAIGRGMEVVGELADGAKIRLLSARGEPGELEVVEHALTKRRVRVEVL